MNKGKNGISKYGDYKKGLMALLTCQLIWGFLPIYWRALGSVESWKLILYRIVMMFIFTLIAANVTYGKEAVWAPIKDRKIMSKYFAAGLALTANWSLYIWAVNSGRVIQSSIGYFIEPIVICALGVVIFHEKLNRYSIASILLALTAIIIILIHYGQLPGVALGLALTWSVYSAIKKTAELPPLISLVYETMPYAALSVIALLYIEIRGIGVLSVATPGQYVLVLLSGLVTLVPVALFGYAAKRVTMLIIGLVQYISPTIMLILGLFLFKEPTDRVQLIALVIIWIGLLIFSYGEVRKHKDVGGDGSF